MYIPFECTILAWYSDLALNEQQSISPPSCRSRRPISTSERKSVTPTSAKTLKLTNRRGGHGLGSVRVTYVKGWCSKGDPGAGRGMSFVLVWQ